MLMVVNTQGVEYNGWSGKNTQVESGLGASTVTIEEFTSPAYIIKVSVTYGTLKHCECPVHFVSCLPTLDNGS